MASVLSAACLYGPSIYCVVGICNTIITPYVIVQKSGDTIYFSDAFPEVSRRVTSLRKDIYLYRAEVPLAGALGTSFGPSAVILYDKELAEGDPDGFNFIMKHEVSHIINNDGFIASLVSSIAAAVAAFAVPYLSSCLPWFTAPLPYCLPALVALNVHANLKFVGEYRADAFAISHATAKELRAIEIALEEEISANKKLHEKHPQFFSAEGNCRAVTDHPPPVRRLAEVQREIASRKLSFSNLDCEEEKAVRAFHKKYLEKDNMFKKR